MTLSRTVLLLSILIACAGSPANADRPTVGLVLSGGGARGLAHIGALELLEQMRVPVDFVAGTSMGSIIGGLYAAGLTPQEIKSAMLAMDWEALFLDRPPRNQRSFRRKRDDRSDFFDFVFGLRGFKPALPPGIVSGQRLTLSLKFPQIFLPDDTRFDDLPIPYRAVSTDIETGEMVVLSSGSLIHAMRASMAIPGVFNPVRLDGRLLVDGGVVRNMPIDVAKRMGADVIIAVDVGTPLNQMSADDLNSIFKITEQAINIYVRESSERYQNQADVLLHVPMPGFSSADFKKAAEIIEAGEQAAESIRQKLIPFAVSKTEYDRFLKRHLSGPKAYPRIDDVEIINHSRIDDYVISRRVRVEAGQELDPVELEHDLTDLYGLGVFERVDFHIREKRNRHILRIEAEEKLSGPNHLIFGLDYLDDLEGQIDFGLLARYTRLEINRLGGEWATDVRLGLTRGVKSEWYQPLEPSRTVFLSVRGRSWFETQDLYKGENRMAEYRIGTIGLGLDAGLQLGTVGECRFGIDRGEVDARVGSGRSPAPSAKRNYGGWAAELTCDLLDEADFPRKGGSGRVRLFMARRELGDVDDYDRLSGDLAQFVSQGNNTLFATLAGGSSLGSNLPFYNQFVLGGPFSFSGLKPGQFRGQTFGVGRIGFYRRLAEGMVIFGTHFYIGGWLETGNIWVSQHDANLNDLIKAGTMVLSAATILGPVQIGYGRNENDVDSFFLTIGRQFGNVHRP
jgi:NTE family protein